MISRKVDVMPGRKGNVMISRKEYVMPGRKGDFISCRKGNVMISRKEYVMPGRKGDFISCRKGGVMISRKEYVMPGRKGDVISCRKGDVMPGSDRASGVPEGIGKGAGEDGGLVVAAGAAAGPMEGDRNDQVDVREVRGGREAAAEEGAEVAPGGQVAVVLQGTRDRPVVPLVMHQGHGVRIVHRLSPPVAFQYRIEPVRQWVMRLQPISGIRHIRRAAET